MLTKNIVLNIPGNPITKKNSSSIYVRRGNNPRPFIATSKQYREYASRFKAYTMAQSLNNKKINEPCNIKCLYYMQTRRKVDLTNLLSATMDCLVDSGVIDDDNCKIVVSNDGSRVFYDKENPRVEITISKEDPTFAD